MILQTEYSKNTPFAPSVPTDIIFIHDLEITPTEDNILDGVRSQLLYNSIEGSVVGSPPLPYLLPQDINKYFMALDIFTVPTYFIFYEGSKIKIEKIKCDDGLVLNEYLTANIVYTLRFFSIYNKNTYDLSDGWSPIGIPPATYVTAQLTKFRWIGVDVLVTKRQCYNTKIKNKNTFIPGLQT